MMILLDNLAFFSVLSIILLTILGLWASRDLDEKEGAAEAPDKIEVEPLALYDQSIHEPRNARRLDTWHALYGLPSVNVRPADDHSKFDYE